MLVTVAETCQNLTIDPSNSHTKKRKRTDKPVEELEVDVSAPEPPSKKALRKAKKAGSAPPSAPAQRTPYPSANSGKKDVGSDGENPTKRGDHGIWIGNLPYTTTKADLRRFFTEKSAMTDEEITRVHLPMAGGSESASIVEKGHKKVHQNKGFAYVDFNGPDAVARALELSDTLLAGRRVLIKKADSFEGRPEVIKTNADLTKKAGIAATKRIFVGNLAFDVTKEDLVDHFGQCGEVTDVHMATFEDSGKCKGFAWVTFRDISAAEACIRGWIKVTEEESSKDGDGSVESQSENDSDGEKRVQKKGSKKQRKVWVNRIKGRQLRMEYAEDKTLRYKKRFGKKGSTAHQPGDGGSQSSVQPTKERIDGDQRPSHLAQEAELNVTVKLSGKKTVFT